jgi:hypothetical protein
MIGGRLLPVFALLAVLAASPARAATACASDRVTPHAVDFLNLDLKEYGWIFYDAQNGACAASAYRGLVRKVEGSLEMGPRENFGNVGTLPFRGWLEGVHVEMIHVSGLLLGGRGRLTPRLDRLLRRVQETYRYTVDPTCDPLSTANTCLDDQSQAAAAHAWMGVYEELAGRHRPARTHLDRAEALLREAFAEANFLCLPAGSSTAPVPCSTIDALASSLADGGTQVVVFNHGFEDMGYGIGLMTSFSSALVAFDVAGRSFVFTETEKAVLRSIFIAGQRGATADGSLFLNDACHEVLGSRVVGGHPCADLGYRPRMFPVRLFYEKHVGVPNDRPYRYDLFDPSLFSAEDDFLNFGRKAIYGELAFRWWKVGEPDGRPPLSAAVPSERTRGKRRSGGAASN